MQNATRNETSHQQWWGDTGWWDMSTWTVMASSCSPLHQHSTSLLAAGVLPSPCPGSWTDPLPTAFPAAEGGLGLQLIQGPCGPPASACMWELHSAEALQRAKTLTTTSALQGCRNRPVPGRLALTGVSPASNG